MKEILSHTVKPNLVTRFKIRETITSEKVVTGTKLIKSAEGISALNRYKRQYRENHDTPLVDTKHFKLCTKSRKSIDECNTPRPRRITQQRRQRRTRKRLSNQRNVASPISLPGNMNQQENLNRGFSFENKNSNNEFYSPLNNQKNENRNNATINQGNSALFYSPNQNNAPNNSPMAEPEPTIPKKKSPKKTRKAQPQTQPVSRRTRSQTKPVSSRTRNRTRQRN